MYRTLVLTLQPMKRHVSIPVLCVFVSGTIHKYSSPTAKDILVFTCYSHMKLALTFAMQPTMPRAILTERLRCHPH